MTRALLCITVILLILPASAMAARPATKTERAALLKAAPTCAPARIKTTVSTAQHGLIAMLSLKKETARTCGLGADVKRLYARKTIHARWHSWQTVEEWPACGSRWELSYLDLLRACSAFADGGMPRAIPLETSSATLCGYLPDTRNTDQAYRFGVYIARNLAGDRITCSTAVGLMWDAMSHDLAEGKWVYEQAGPGVWSDEVSLMSGRVVVTAEEETDPNPPAPAPVTNQ